MPRAPAARPCPDARPGPARLRMNVDVTAHSVIDEEKLAAVAQAADALVAAIRDAGVGREGGRVRDSVLMATPRPDPDE